MSKGILCKDCVRRNEPLLDDEDLDDDGDDMRMMTTMKMKCGMARLYIMDVRQELI